MRRLALWLLLLSAPALAQEPSKFTLPQGGSGPATYAGSASAGGPATTALALNANGVNCSAGQYPLGVDASGAAESCTAAATGTIGGTLGSTDNAICRVDGTGGSTIQGSLLTIDDTTGNLTGPSGGFSIIGGTGAGDSLTLDGSAGTAGSVSVSAAGAINLTNGTGGAGIYPYATGYLGVYGNGGTGVGQIITGGLTVDSLYGDDVGAALQDNNGYGMLILGSTARMGSITTSSIGIRNSSTAQTLQVYGTSDSTWSTLTNYARLSLAATDGTSTITTERAGTAAADQNLVVKGEGATATLTLDGSDDVAGAVTVTAAGGATFSATVNGTVLQLYNGADVVHYFGRQSASYPIWKTDSDGQIAWSSGDVGTVTIDSGIARAGVGVLRISNGGTGAGSLLYLKKVTADTDGETTTAVQSGTLWTNTGDADGESITLLNDPTVGVSYCFAVDAAQTLTILPSTGESLYYGTDQCVVSLTSNSAGSTLCVTAVVGGSGGKWFTMSHEGTWACNDA